MIIKVSFIYKLSLLFVVFFASSLLNAQTTYNISGLVKSKNESIGMAIVGFAEINKWTTTNDEGEFIINNVPAGEYTLQVSFLSYKEYSEKINIKSNICNKEIELFLSDVNLREVTVIAKESKSSNTSSRINREAISHLQPSSFSELLELLPGNGSHDPYLGGVNIVGIRQVGKDVNTSLGTSFVIDGAPISNDANLHSISGSWERKISKRNITGYGIDMRTISTDEIETVEIVRGVPSVKYGDLSSGLINIKRKKGKTPYEFRFKADPNTKMASVSRGFSLSDSSSINIGVNYLDYKVDPRNELENFKRVCSSVRYNNKLEIADYNADWNINLDYTGSFDDDKQDKEINYGVNDYYSSSYNKLRLSGSIRWYRKNNNFFKGFDFRFNSSYTHDEQIRDKLVSQDRDIPWITTRNEGESDGGYLPNEYQAHMEVDSKPINIFSQISADFEFPVWILENTLMLGADYKYDKNMGKGELINPDRPAYISSSRPRAYRSVPSQQRLGFFIENNLNVPIGDNQLNIVAGLRATKLLNLGSKFDISKKLFIEPRLNIQWKFPEFTIFNNDINLSLNGGLGSHRRFPVLSHLYPNDIYYDLVQLNYYHQNPDYRRVNFATHIVNRTNYSIQPANNKKYEIGVDVDVTGNSISITAFKEYLSSGFRTNYGYKSFIHKKYDNQSVNHETLTEKPRLEDMTFALDTNVYMYGKNGNGSLLIKSGIEFQFDFKRIKALYTKLTINGAWFKTTYSNSMPVLNHRSVVLNGETIDFIGEYDWDSGYTRERFNTNFRFDTHIPKMGLIFSTLIECEWFSSKQSIKKDSRPISYIDKEGNRYAFTAKSEEDYRLKWLMLAFNEYAFEKQTDPFAAYVNLKITKKFNKNISFAMYVNRVLTYLPVYECNGFEISRRSSPYFGMEFKIKL